MRDAEKPTVTKSSWVGTEETDILSHPAFGMIGASHVSGPSRLHGSDFVHQNHVCLRISTGTVRRSLSQNWYQSEKQIIEVALSEAQWVSMIASPNKGEGVPCTITWQRDGGMTPEILPLEPRAETYKREMNDATEDARVRLAEAIDMARGKKVPKSVIEAMEGSYRALTSSIPFVESQFSEHVEETVERAKVEVHAHMRNEIMRAGLTTLLAKSGPLLIDGDDEQ